MSPLSFLKKIFKSSASNENLFFEELKKQFTVDGKFIYAGELLRMAYKKYPNKSALISKDQVLTYKEFYFRTLLFAQKLRAKGIKPRDKVILYCENSMAFFIAYFAIWQCSAVAIPLNVFLHEKEIDHILKDSKASAAFASKSLKTNLENVIKNENFTILTEDEIDFETVTPDKIERFFPTVSFEGLAPEELCLMLYTSGTTGQPKGVMLSSTNILTNVIQVYARFKSCGLSEQERMFCVLPLFHVFAQNTCIWLPVITGSSVIIVQKIDRKLILDGLEKRPTVFLGFPALYGLLCLMKTAPLDSIKFFVSGADMLPDKIQSAFSLIYGRKICAGYGLTEASPVVSINYHNEENPTNVVGSPIPGLKHEIRNAEEEMVKPGEIGVLWLKGGNIMMGYHNAPHATAQILKDGWLNTGDLARETSDGFLAIRGRTKDLIIHKGFNIYPAEIENVLMRHPAVSKAAVIGQDDPLTGEIPIAFLAVKTDNINLEADLREWCASNLASYKIPRKFMCMEDLPMNSTGKVDKKKLVVN